MRDLIRPTLLLILLVASVALAQTRSPQEPPAVSPSPRPARPAMQATVSAVVEGQFVVDEKSLRRLREVISQRIAEATKEHTILYRADFEAGFFYETDDLDVILAEDNRAPKRITKLRITAAESFDSDLGIEPGALRQYVRESPNLQLDLDSSGARYTLTSGNRDWVLTTQVDLVDRVNAMVVTSMFGRNLWGFLLLPLVLLLVLIAAAIMKQMHDFKMRRIDPEFQASSLWRFVTTSGNRLQGFSLSSAVVQLGMMGVVGALWGGATFGDLLSPPIVFNFGAEMQRYAGLVELRNFILYGVLVTITLSVIGNLLTPRLK